MRKADRLKSQWAKDDADEIDAAIHALLEHRHGRRMLWWLLQVGRWGTQPYSGNALATAFGCGELNIGQQVADRILQVSPEGFVLMMKESNDERRTRDTALADAYDADRRSDADSNSGADADADA